MTLDIHPPLILPCKYCGDPIQRAVDPPHDWVHSDDYITLTWKFYTDFPIVVRMEYDHDAEPDVIEIEAPKRLPRLFRRGSVKPAEPRTAPEERPDK